jgi:hypothetical protein
MTRLPCYQGQEQGRGKFSARENRGNACGAGLSRLKDDETKDDNRGEQGRNHQYTSC